MSWGGGPYGRVPYGARMLVPGDLRNLSFEIPDTDGIGAKYWALGTIASLEAWASFLDGDGFPITFETFEFGWGAQPYLYVFAPSNLTPGIFSVGIQGSPKLVENFELGWLQNHHYQYDIVGIDSVFTGVGQTNVEDFEAGWPGAYALEFAPGDLSAGLTEAFESGWHSNESYAFTMGATSSAVFAGANADAAETFNRVRPRTPTFLESLVDGSWLGTAHGFSLGYLVVFSNDSGLLPRGIRPETVYEVSNIVDADTYQVKVPGAGSTFIPSDFGTGLTYVSDETEFWSMTMRTT